MKRRNHPPQQPSRYAPAIGLFNFLYGAFYANETFYTSSIRQHNQYTRHPLTDIELAQKIISHFPEQWRLLEMPIDKYYGFWPTVNYYRGRFNHGRLNHGIPEVYSFRYNASGQRVSERSGKRLLTASEITLRIITHESRRQDAQCSTTRESIQGSPVEPPS